MTVEDEAGQRFESMIPGQSLPTRKLLSRQHGPPAFSTIPDLYLLCKSPPAFAGNYPCLSHNGFVSNFLCKEPALDQAGHSLVTVHRSICTALQAPGVPKDRGPRERVFVRGVERQVFVLG